MDDLEGISREIARESPQSAANLVSRMFATTDHLTMFPKMGRLILNIQRDDVREIIVDNHRIVYVIEGDAVAILRVRHGARPLGDIPGL